MMHFEVLRVLVILPSHNVNRWCRAWAKLHHALSTHGVSRTRGGVLLARIVAGYAVESLRSTLRIIDYGVSLAVSLVAYELI